RKFTITISNIPNPSTPINITNHKALYARHTKQIKQNTPTAIDHLPKTKTSQHQTTNNNSISHALQIPIRNIPSHNKCTLMTKTNTQHQIRTINNSDHHEPVILNKQSTNTITPHHNNCPSNIKSTTSNPPT
ncbi:MAG: hypothetical protein O7C59_07510, partial [Rickettsia endosymbiont of Ixodes persulcatus]|nr:hypothetical protein [Rickettsia endosymbiont of Ixodes persulcatus]